MRLKRKIVLAMTGLVLVVASVLSSLYLSQLFKQQIQQTYASTDIVAHQIVFTTRQALEDGLRGVPINQNDAQALRAAVARALRDDPGLNALLNSVISYSPTVFDISIADPEGRALLSTDPVQQDQLVPRRQEYGALQAASVLQEIEIVFGPPRVYNVSLDLTRNKQPFVTVHIGIRTTLLRNSFLPWLVEALSVIGFVMLASLLVSVFVANLASSPIERISRQLDTLRAEAEGATEIEAGPPERSVDTVAQVSSKIERIGRRMRNVEEVFSALKENLDQILFNLQDGMMLFTRDARAVLVSSSVERFLGVERDRILGSSVHEIFDRNTILGRTVREAFDAGMSLVQEEVETETGRRVEVSLDFIHEESTPEGGHAFGHGGGLGALLTLHDLESMREIENELELSRRMAAIGRLTAGVGHEVKNPINAIVVHLELLRTKLDTTDGRALRHLDVIQSEIQRLDRVVQTLVDFSRPVELQLKDQDLRAVVSSVITLATAELNTQGVRVLLDLPERPVVAKLDADLFKQALLNVVLNGAQAMPGGGTLEVRLAEDARWAVLSIRDEGTGIPPEVLPRIFDLYFTTKKDGSGIGLAMTYRIVQLHNGKLDVESHLGKGTRFTLRVPANSITDIRTRTHLDTGTALLQEPNA